MERRLLHDLALGDRTFIVELLIGIDQPLLFGRDALLVLDSVFDIEDGVRGLHLEGDGVARQGLYEDLHLRFSARDEKNWAQVEGSVSLLQRKLLAGDYPLAY